MQCSCVHMLTQSTKHYLPLVGSTAVSWSCGYPPEVTDPAQPLLDISMIHISVETIMALLSCTFTCSVTLLPQENIFTVPNLISVSRIALSPVLGYLVLVESYMLALGLFSLASISDLVSCLRQVGWVVCSLGSEGDLGMRLGIYTKVVCEI